MPKEFSRTQRVAEQMQREIAQLLQREANDPRLSAVTVAEVRVSTDLVHAKVYVTSYVQDADPKQIEQALARAGGFIRSALGKRMRMRIVPKLEFIFDTTAMDGERLSSLIEQVNIRDKS